MNGTCSTAALAVVAALSTGCTFAPSEKSIAAADFGSSMTTSEMTRLADDHLVEILKDPESRRVEWGHSGRAWLWRDLIGGGHVYGYGLAASVNAKNSFGGYTGAKPYVFFFRDGALTATYRNSYGDIFGFVD